MRPQRPADMTVKDIFIDHENKRIQYKLYYKINAEYQSWFIPDNSTFMPPEGFEDGTDWAIWSEKIQVVKKLASGKTRKGERWDWVYAMPMDEYLKLTEPVSNLALHARNSVRKEAIKQIEAKLNETMTAVKKFNELFDRDDK